MMRIDDIALRAAEMQLFQDLVNDSNSNTELMRSIREALSETFPEIDDIPNPTRPGYEAGMPTKNNFLIAKKVVELLQKN